MNRRKLLLTTARGALLTAFGAVTGARAQTPIDSRTVLPIPQAPVKSPPALDARDARSPVIHPLRAPQGAPNIVIVLLDDMGFGASSAYGGPCNMPVAERLAYEGLTYTRFHTTALCSPTRQALLTGRNHHSVNLGSITELATGFPRLHIRSAGQRGNHRANVETQRLQHGRLRQDAPNTRLGDECLRSV